MSILEFEGFYKIDLIYGHDFSQTASDYLIMSIKGCRPFFDQLFVTAFINLGFFNIKIFEVERKYFEFIIRNSHLVLPIY